MACRWVRGEAHVHLVADVDLALARVAARVAFGGHDVPEETVRRRFAAGLRYFFTLYRYRVDDWALYDNDDGGPVLLASGDSGSESCSTQLRLAHFRSGQACRRDRKMGE